MAFDQSTRNRLQKFVSDSRNLLSEEFTRQLQNDYGLDPHTGTVSPLGNLGHLDDTHRETARILRDALAHYLASSPSGGAREALERIIREQAFTVLNRLAALRMTESRGILIESVGNGYQSKGFQLYERLAGSGLGETGDTYRCYLFSIFDEFALDLKVLFDRFSPQGRLFPRETALLDLLKLLNDPDLAHLWAEDETIGWVYQYFNSKEERKKMRDESAAPRNSRELAVRNQFFTPRYVVEFLTDNTLGRIWYEMTQGETGLKDFCRYLVCRPAEIFLKPGEAAPVQAASDEHLSQEELLKQPVYIPHRPLKDPRTLRMLDPACGSMHFGLYSFDLFERIYEEAWELELRLGGAAFVREAGLKPLTESYPDKDAFLRDVPRLIIEHNIHGIDIDPRAVQIAGLSLWLRAQRSWHNQGVKSADRPRITRSNIVCAEPMPGEKELLREFTSRLEVPALGYLVEQVFDKMQLAGEAGSLIKIEEEIREIIAETKRLWKAGPKHKQKGLFGEAPAKPEQAELPLSFTGITDERFWEGTEEKLYHALQEYAEVAAEHCHQRRLFAEDAERGFAFIDICRKRYDVVVMNPPFGAASKPLQTRLEQLGFHSRDLAADFVTNSLRLAISSGFVGAITTRTIFFLKGFLDWRDWLVKEFGGTRCFLDIGFGVLDAAVEASAFTVHASKGTFLGHYFRGLGQHSQLEDSGPESVWRMPQFLMDARSFARIPREPFAYWCSPTLLTAFEGLPKVGDRFDVLSGGNPRDDFRFVRHWLEIPTKYSSDFVPYSKGGEFAFYYFDVHLMLNWVDDGRELKAHAAEYRRQLGWSPDWRALIMNFDRYFTPGITWPRRTSRLSFRFLPEGCVFGDKSPVILSRSTNLKQLYPLIGYLNTSTFCDALNLMVGSSELAQSFEVGIVKSCPLPDGVPERQDEIVRDIFQKLYGLDRGSENSHAYVGLPLRDYFQTSLQVAFNKFGSDRKGTIEQIVSSQGELESIANEALSSEGSAPSLSVSDFNELMCESFVSACISQLFGCTFGRLDIRYATGEMAAPELPDPFAPLPVCSPGQLLNAQCLPVRPEEVSAAYPIRIPWNGILVDDLNHPLDIERRVRELVEIIRNDRAEAIEHEACKILGMKSFRDYFRKPAGFFADHLKRYSKSRRQAPIYWPLSTPSGFYTLWVYCHRLNDQTLYTCVNDFVEPKLRDVSGELSRIRQKGDGRSRTEEKELESLQDFEMELQDFRDELLRLTLLPWRPNLNDGVQITAAPLWKLFQLPKWKKTLKETWEKLEKGDYDWAHLAYSIWPDRVREKCKKDKSLAIAHDLEDLYIEPPASAKKKRGKNAAVVENQD